MNSYTDILHPKSPMNLSCLWNGIIETPHKITAGALTNCFGICNFPDFSWLCFQIFKPVDAMKNLALGSNPMLEFSDDVRQSINSSSLCLSSLVFPRYDQKPS